MPSETLYALGCYSQLAASLTTFAALLVVRRRDRNLPPWLYGLFVLAFALGAASSGLLVASRGAVP